MRKIGSAWIKDNLFKFKKGDGGAYFFLYLVVPAIISYVSLKVAKDPFEIAYSYVSILISSLNCIYDAANRWNRESKSIINLKISIMSIFLVIILTYCIYVIVAILLKWAGIMYFSWIFYAYYVVATIAIIDIVACFGRDIALKACVQGE